MKKYWVVGTISDQVQNNYEAWLVGGQRFENEAAASEYAAELQEQLDVHNENGHSGESVYFQSHEIIEEEQEFEWDNEEEIEEEGEEIEEFISKPAFRSKNLGRR